MRKIKRVGSFILAVCLLVVSIGCGQIQSKKGVKDSGNELAGGSGLSMEEQLKVLCKHSDKWLEQENKKKPYLTYAVTDLDQNGRWEIIASADRQGSGRFSYTDYFQVNEAGDGLEKIQTSYKEGESQIDLANDLETAYYDPEKEEYHYITGDFATAGAAAGYSKSIEALTLSDGKIRIDSLGYESCEKDSGGKEKTTYYKMESGKEKKIEKMNFSRDLLGDEAYPACGKLNTHIAWFQFENRLDKVTEESLLYYLRRSAAAFSLADPLVKKKKVLHGFPCEVPQYTTMSDTAKQERLNALITRETGKSLKDLETESFHLDDFSCMIKRNDAGYLSLLIECSGMGEGAAHPSAWADTVNIDCKKERVLAQADLLPEDEREFVEMRILEEDCEDIRDIGYRSYRLKKGEENLLESPEDWKNVDVYQTRNKIGVVIPCSHAIGSYQIYEVSEVYDPNDPEGIVWDQVDWDAYQYKLPAADYKVLQAYMPVLKEEKTFLWEDEQGLTRPRGNTDLSEVTVQQFFQKMRKEAEIKNIKFPLDNIMLCDVTQDGQKELILSFDTLGYFYLLLHKEGDQFYGIYLPVRWFEDLRDNGIYMGFGGWCYYYQMRFADGKFQNKRLGGYERLGLEEERFMIGKRKVKQKEFEKWQEKTLGKKVPAYEPFAKKW